MSNYQPLAERLRPTNLSEYIGQTHLLGEGRALARLLASNKLHSMVFWGPPGTGKTTLARLIAKQSDLDFISISAVLDGVKEVRQAVEKAKLQREQFNQGTLLFVDEVHRFNKAQQDAFLPFVEDGTFLFIGATTENPSFELNKALLSRAKVYVLTSLDEEELEQVLGRGVAELTKELDTQVVLEAGAADILIEAADGDARRLLNFLEQLVDLAEEVSGKLLISKKSAAEVVGQGIRRFDKSGEVFYDQASALHKSIRGSDANAALYWLVRMLDGGADPRYLARRLIRMASEEIGNADPRALAVAINAAESYERLGTPEGELALAQAATYLAVAPKSNAVYMAYNAAVADIKDNGSHDVPIHLRNAPTKLMEELDYGAEYRYAHNEPEAYAAGECYFPDAMPERDYYQPVERGLEIKISAKMAHLRNLDAVSANKRRG